MSRRNRRITFLLWLHIFLCFVWCTVAYAERQPPFWMVHVFFWSTVGIQFSWGYTVGLIAGPGRDRRKVLWFSLLTLFMPLLFVRAIFSLILHVFGLPTALMYLGIFAMVLACETFCGVLLGARAHSRLDR